MRWKTDSQNQHSPTPSSTSTGRPEDRHLQKSIWVRQGPVPVLHKQAKHSTSNTDKPTSTVQAIQLQAKSSGWVIPMLVLRHNPAERVDYPSFGSTLNTPLTYAPTRWDSHGFPPTALRNYPTDISFIHDHLFTLEQYLRRTDGNSNGPTVTPTDRRYLRQLHRHTLQLRLIASSTITCISTYMGRDVVKYNIIHR